MYVLIDSLAANSRSANHQNLVMLRAARPTLAVTVASASKDEG